MGKKKIVNRWGFGLTLILVVGFTALALYKSSKGSVLGEYNSNSNNYGQGNGNGYGNHNKDDSDDGYSYTEDDEGNILNESGTPNVEVTETPLPTPHVTEYQEVLDIEPTVVQPTDVLPTVVQPTQTEQENNQQSNEDSENRWAEIRSDLVVVPVSERSMTVSQSAAAPIPVVTRSFVRTIKKKIEQVGRGQFLSSPKRVLTPTPAKEQERSSGDEDVIGVDTDIFYSLTDKGVLLAASNTEGKTLSVPDQELRSAEITMNRVLQKQNLKLGVSSEQEFVIQEGGVRVTLGMPIYVNVSNHKVKIENNGERIELNMTPVEAVRKAIDYGYFEKTSTEELPEIREWRQKLVYEIPGEKSYMLFGKYPFSLSRSVFVDIENGDVEQEEDSFLVRMVQVLSM